MSEITENSSLLEVAAIVSEALQEAGIAATLSGGGAVCIYSQNEYQSEDLDFVTAAMISDLTPVLETLGFRHSGTPRLAQYEHPLVDWYLEFPPAPLSFGHLYINHRDCPVIEAGKARLRIISPTHSVMDRLAAAIAWKDVQAREQATLVAANNDVDWQAIKDWMLEEGETMEEFERFKSMVARFNHGKPGG